MPRSSTDSSTSSLVALALGFALVAVPGFDNGGYQDTVWTWYTLALLSLVGIRLIGAGRPAVGRPAVLMLAALAGLVGWMWLSRLWSVDGSQPDLEARRCLLYAAVLLALVTCVERHSASWLLVGIFAGILGVSGYALVDRIVWGADEIETSVQGARLVGTMGYSNGLGALAAMGIVLGVGLASSTSRRGVAAGVLAGVVVLAVALTLTESAGAMLALAAGFACLLALASGHPRHRVLATLAAGLLPIGAAVALLLATGRASVGVPALSLGVREHYWRVAADDVAAHPLHGAGAGSFRVSWLEERRIAANARDAHSVYIETFGELGLVGLVLVAVVILIPVVIGIRGRDDLLVATATSAFVVYALHAAIDWDWELPAVTMTALGCAAAVLGLTTARRPGRLRRGSRQEG